jgi:NTP pyrophosphatase (non-canonical NTP hydrolase)
MNLYQQQIKKFCEERGWEKFHNPKDLLLGIVEEVGELRNLIKWEQDPETIKKVLLKNKKEVEDNIGDILWFLAILANSVNVDMDKAIKKVIASNKKRFPLRKTKGKHTNIFLGGYDGIKSSKESCKP